MPRRMSPPRSYWRQVETRRGYSVVALALALAPAAEAVAVAVAAQDRGAPAYTAEVAWATRSHVSSATLSIAA